MSVEATTWVWNHSKATGSTFVVLLALADHAHPDGSHAYPSVAKLAAMARVSERTVQYALRQLAELGEVEVKAQARQHRATEYVLCQVASRGADPAPLRRSRRSAAG